MKKDDQTPELILLDKGPFQSLNDQELKILDRHKILVPDIFLIENLKRKETVNKLSKIKNAYRIKPWNLLAKENLLGQLDRSVTVTQEDISRITNDPAELKKQTKLAKEVARYYDNYPHELLKKNVDLSSKGNKDRIVNRIISELERRGVEVTNTMIETAETLYKQKGSLFTIEQGNWAQLSQIIVDDLNNKPIRDEDKPLKEDERKYIRNKEWLDFACRYFQTTEEEKTQIFNRWNENYKHPLKDFAPYAYYILVLEMTIGLHITKSKGNHKREIMRDLGYLYYANFDNVTFHTCDRKLKDTIQKIPFLKHIQEKMVYFNNDAKNKNGELNKPKWLKTLIN